MGSSYSPDHSFFSPFSPRRSGNQTTYLQHSPFLFFIRVARQQLRGCHECSELLNFVIIHSQLEEFWALLSLVPRLSRNVNMYHGQNLVPFLRKHDQRQCRRSGWSGQGQTTFQQVVGLVPRLHRHPLTHVLLNTHVYTLYNVQLLAIWRIPQLAVVLLLSLALHVGPLRRLPTSPSRVDLHESSLICNGLTTFEVLARPLMMYRKATFCALFNQLCFNARCV